MRLNTNICMKPKLLKSRFFISIKFPALFNRMELEQLESKVKKLEDQLKASNEAFEQQSSDPKVKDLER